MSRRLHSRLFVLSKTNFHTSLLYTGVCLSFKRHSHGDMWKSCFGARLEGRDQYGGNIGRGCSTHVQVLLHGGHFKVIKHANQRARRFQSTLEVTTQLIMETRYKIYRIFSIKRRGRLFKTRLRRPGVYSNPAFIQGPAFRRISLVRILLE